MKKLYLVDYFSDIDMIYSPNNYGGNDLSQSYVVYSGNGFINNKELIEDHFKKNDVTIFTNDILSLLWCSEFWDENEGHMIYLKRVGDSNFTKISELTDRELRYGHDIFKMYINGEFNKEVK